MNKKMKVIVSGLILASLGLTACGGNKQNEKSAKQKNSDKDTITWMAMLHTPTPPSGEVQKKIENYTNKKIKFSWIPDASKTERINAALASGTLADIVSLTEINNTTVRNSLASGMFWDVEPYLKDYSNLSKISKDRLEAARISGHIYGVPYQKPIARYGVLIRKDWLDNLHLEVPNNVEELKNIARAFTEEDPDGNGKKDTVGIVDRNESFSLGFKTLTGYFGAGNMFVVKNNQIIPTFMQPEYKEAMKWYRDIYQNGWMNSDFSVMPKNDQKDYIVQGKGGIVITGMQEAKNYVSAAKGTQEEDMEWVLVNDMVDTNGERRILSDTNDGMGGWLSIPKQNVKTEKELKNILMFINDLISEEPYSLMTRGIKDVHYKVNKDGSFEHIDETKWQQEVQPFASSRPSELVTTYKSTDPLSNEATKKTVENEKFAITNPAQPLESKTYTTEWSTLIEGVEDAYYKYMLGEIDMAGFDKAVDQWKQSGGDKIIKEFTEDYKKQSKK